MDTPYNRLVNALKHPLSGLGATNTSQVAAKIAQNVKNPVGSDPRVVGSVFGTADEFMASYKNFEDMYKIFLTKELESNLISPSQRRLLQSAANSPNINLGLIKNLQHRKQLQAAFDNAFNMQGVIENFGAPGVPLPSSNLFRAAGRYLVDQQRS